MEQDGVLYEASFPLAEARAFYRLFFSAGGLCLEAADGAERSFFDLSGIPKEEALSFVRALAESETAPCMLEELFEEVFP